MIGRDDVFDAAYRIGANAVARRAIIRKIDIKTRLRIAVIKCVGTFTTDIGVIAQFADKAVVTGTTDKHIVASTASNDIIPIAAIKTVIAIIADDGVVMI